MSYPQISPTMPLLQESSLVQVPSVNFLMSSVANGSFDQAVMHTPTNITERAVEYAKSVEADLIVSIGGGSTIGLGKAIFIRNELSHICIPTTHAGPEMTSILGETANARKNTRSDPKILPGTVICDVELTMTLPARFDATSGINAIAHAVEALYAQDRNPIIDLLSLEGIKALVESLLVIITSPHNMEARGKTQYGAWLCGLSLGSVFNTPHADTHAIILPHALAYNAPMIPDTMKRLADVLPESGGNAIQGLNMLLRKLKVNRDLKTFGFKEEDIDRAAAIAIEKSYYNPQPIERDLVREVLHRAYAGEEGER